MSYLQEKSMNRYEAASLVERYISRHYGFEPGCIVSFHQNGIVRTNFHVNVIDGSVFSVSYKEPNRFFYLGLEAFTEYEPQAFKYQDFYAKFLHINDVLCVNAYDFVAILERNLVYKTNGVEQ